jgi:anti-sigma factor RsiW
MTLPHLTDEQLTDYLSGDSLPAIEDHLAACDVCRREIASMRASFQVFDHGMERTYAECLWLHAPPCCALMAARSSLGCRLLSRDCSCPAVRPSAQTGKDFAVRRCNHPGIRRRQRYRGT